MTLDEYVLIDLSLEKLLKKLEIKFMWPRMSKNRAQTILLFLILLWLFLVITIFFNVSGLDYNNGLKRRLAKVRHELEERKSDVQQLTLQLRRFTSSVQSQNCSSLLHKLNNSTWHHVTDLLNNSAQLLSNGGYEISPEHERWRRKAIDDVKEIWYYVRTELVKLRSAKVPPTLEKQIDTVKHRIRDQYLTTMAHLYHLSHTAQQDLWRERESAELSALVQHRFQYLQNPPRCLEAKRVLCNLNKGCGFGCQLHHLLYCFTVAYGTKRTLVLDSRQWRYANQGWETLFLPLSRTCTDFSGAQKLWPGDKRALVIKLPIIDTVSPRPGYLPLAVPQDLAPRLLRLHGDPAAWWNGQIVRYLMRPNEEWREHLDNKMVQLEFYRPIVGLQIRRTDKLFSEAKFHALSEYMEHVEEYFDMLDKVKGSVKRRIYIASDDISVHSEARHKYPNYDVLGDVEISRSAQPENRYNLVSLQGVLTDIYMLARCDYLVCTFSSQVCRVAYEEMQTLRPDAAADFYSLDDIYYFGGQLGHTRVAKQRYKAQNEQEIDLEPGDVVGILGNHWDGYSKGHSDRTGKTGLFPSYMVEDNVRIQLMPMYQEADDQFYASQKYQDMPVDRR